MSAKPNAPPRMTNPREAGFTLVEVLVALVVAGLFLPVFGRALSGAWSSSRTSMDIVAAVVLARDAALGAPGETLSGSFGQGFAINRSSGSVNVVVKSSRLAPALIDAPDQARDKREAASTPPNMRLAEPKGIVQSTGDVQGADLRHVSVTVATPAGRRFRFDIIRIDDAAP